MEGRASLPRGRVLIGNQTATKATTATAAAIAAPFGDMNGTWILFDLQAPFSKGDGPARAKPRLKNLFPFSSLEFLIAESGESGCPFSLRTNWSP
jgi:hypothetical protein